MQQDKIYLIKICQTKDLQVLFNLENWFFMYSFSMIIIFNILLYDSNY